MIKEIFLETTKKQEIIDITDKIENIILSSEIQNGICFVYSPHTTSGIIINENSDVGVFEDILNKLEDLVPSKGNYLHDDFEKNAHAHIKSTLVGSSKTIIVKNKKLLLGKWQGIGFAEFDGPRQRKIFIKIIENGK